MRRIVLVIGLLLFLTACTQGQSTVICTKEFSEDRIIERTIRLNATGNTLNRVEFEDKIYFDDTFTPEILENLEKDLEKKLSDAKNLTYEVIKEDDFVLIQSVLKNIKEAHANELSFVGLEIEDKDFTFGLKETIALNEESGFVCIVK